MLKNRYSDLQARKVRFLDFNDELAELLVNSGNDTSLQAVTNLLPATQKHRVMTYLNAARNAGICSYTVKRVDGNLQIVIKKGQVE